MSVRPFEELPALTPLNFFGMIAEVRYSKKQGAAHRLPDSSALLAESRFADVLFSWNEEGISISVVVDKPFEEAMYPDFAQGDALELFFDTRDVKSSSFLTRFCHRFLILPVAVQGIQALELTSFRTEDTHPLADPADLCVKATLSKNSYQLDIFFPAHCLHGYDPTQFDRMGFTYRLHRKGGAPQHFSASSADFNIEQNPRLWGSLKLIQP